MSLVVLVVSIVVGHVGVGGVVVAIAWAAAIWLSRYSGKTRCNSCGRLWVAG